MDRIISSIRLVTLTLAGVTLGLESKTDVHFEIHTIVNSEIDVLHDFFLVLTCCFF